MGAHAAAAMMQSRNRTMPKPAKPAADAADADLLDAIGQRQDRAAFAEIYERHKDSAYGLIFHIVRDRQRAEDALQDAFLNVWRHAAGLRDHANARGWILRVAANEALRTVKAGRHARRNLELDADRHEAAPETNAGREGAPVDPELAAALNTQLEKLEPEQRNLIALYYAGNLSQREIGEALDITQQAISRKMTAALEALRRGLTQAGYATALPLLESGRLAEALGAQHPAPAALGAKMLRVLNAPAEASRRAAPIASGSSALIAAALVCAAAAGGAYLYLGGDNDTQSVQDPEPATAKTPETSNTQSVLTAEPEKSPVQPRFRRKWDFNNANQLDALFGTNHGMALVPNEGADGKGCLDTGTDLTLRYLPGLPKLSLPIRMRWRERFYLTPTISPPTRVFVSWTDESYRTFAPIRNAGEILTSSTGSIPWRRSEVYITENFCAGWLDGKLTTVEYFELTADQKLMFAARGRYLFDEFEVEEVEPNDVPDLSVYAKFIAAVPPERRVGRVNAPDLVSPQPGREVYVEFLKSPFTDEKKSGR